MDKMAVEKFVVLLGSVLALLGCTTTPSQPVEAMLGENTSETALIIFHRQGAVGGALTNAYFVDRGTGIKKPDLMVVNSQTPDRKGYYSRHLSHHVLFLDKDRPPELEGKIDDSCGRVVIGKSSGIMVIKSGIVSTYYYSIGCEDSRGNPLSRHQSQLQTRVEWVRFLGAAGPGGDVVWNRPAGIVRFDVVDGYGTRFSADDLQVEAGKSYRIVYEWSEGTFKIETLAKK